MTPEMKKTIAEKMMRRIPLDAAELEEFKKLLQTPAVVARFDQAAATLIGDLD